MLTHAALLAQLCATATLRLNAGRALDCLWLFDELWLIGVGASVLA